MEDSSPSLILALDVGTTTIRAHVINKEGTVLHSECSQVELLYPRPGYVEIDPEPLWQSIIQVLRSCIQAYQDVACLAISCQRCTFVTWNRDSLKPYHNFITWKDIRASSIVDSINNSNSLKALRTGAKCLHLITGSNRFLAGSVLRLLNPQVTPRLIWVLQNHPEMKADSQNKKVAFGTVDTWVLSKLTEGNLHVTDASNASATGLYDPFTMSWGTWAIKLLKIPETILPQVVDSSGKHFGSVSKNLFGRDIPILSCIADQGAAAYGSCCFDEGDLKITMGTGSFLNANTGKNPYASISGLYPTIGWKVRDEIVFLAEGASNDTGSIIKWALEFGLIGNPQESSAIASSVPNSDGVFFIPSFCGLQAPVNDPQAAAGFIGVKPTTKKAHFVRAVLEAIAYRAAQIFKVFLDESKSKVSLIKVDGGVSNNDFILQVLADLADMPVERAENTETSALGAAFLAGRVLGFWSDQTDLRRMRTVDRIFKPSMNRGATNANFEKWCKAIDRFCKWYD